MTRRGLLSSALLPAMLRGQQQQPRPNILMIVADDLGWGDVSYHGTPDIRTPHIDSLAKGGMRFTNFYANCPVCSPTRSSLFSGLYPVRTGVQGVLRRNATDNWGHLSSKVTLLPEVLQRRGYATALVGKWHLGHGAPNDPNSRGFDRFQGMHGGMLMDYWKHTGHQATEPDMWRDRNPIKVDGHATDIFGQWARETLADLSRGSKPFYLAVMFNAPHTPIQPKPEWLDRVRKRHPRMSELRANLVALVEHLDEVIGRVLAAVPDNTLIAFTSDNGGQCSAGGSNGPWRGCKEDMYEGGIRVAGCVQWKGKVAAGSSTDRTCLSMDLAATLAEAAGVTLPQPVDGVSFLPTMLSRPQQAPERDLFWSRREGNARYQGKTIHAVRRGDWKLVHNSPFAPLELYNLKDDPAEKVNLADREKAKFNELSAALRKHVQLGGEVPWFNPADFR